MRVPIKGYEGIYDITSDGEVISLPKIIMMPKGGLRKSPEIILKQGLNTKGYPMVILQKDGIRYTARVHRLVAETFIPNPDGKDQVNHIDGNKLNNSASNLEWCTNSENMKHAKAIGLRDNIMPQGIECVHSKFKIDDINFIRSSNKEVKELASIYGVNKSTIQRILNFKTYKNVK